MTTEERLAELEREQAETKAKLAPLEKALEAQRQEVRARSFVLVDEDGKTRGALKAGKEGPVLKLADETGKSRAMLGVDKNGPKLILRDESGKVRVWLVAGRDGPKLNLYDENGVERAVLNIDKDGLRLCDANGKVYWAAPPDPPPSQEPSAKPSKTSAGNSSPAGESKPTPKPLKGWIRNPDGTREPVDLRDLLPKKSLPNGPQKDNKV